MQRKYFIFLIGFYLFSLANIKAQDIRLSGTIADSNTKKPIEFATIIIKEQGLWGVSNTKGVFEIKRINKGKIFVTASCLGYVKKTIQLDINKDTNQINIFLQQDNLSIDEVVVTADRVQTELNTSYNIDRNALNHLQMVNVADVTSLLPGGQTNKILKLTSPTYIALRSEGLGEKGTPSFGTAIEVDGVRLSANENFSSNAKGADLRSVATSNIESVEVVAGIPSVEHGDLDNGMIKISTRKGKSPYLLELSSNINTKQISVNKGFNLEKKRGILNASFEHTKSIHEIMSPYTSYQRNVLTLNYSKLIRNKEENPLLISVGITGNMGGYDSKSDPDFFSNTFEKSRDNTLRANFKLNYLANKSWITNVNFFFSGSYTDKLYSAQKRLSSSSSMSSLHGKEEGYFVGEKYENNPDAPIIMVAPGYWYEKSYTDRKPIDTKIKLKANLFKKFKQTESKSKLGFDFTYSGDMGKGTYYSALEYAPTWRSYPYNKVPFTSNLAIFLEERFIFSLQNHQKIQLQGGLRSDNTLIKNSIYGMVSSWSPRFNAKYTIFFSEKAIKKINVYAGWGQMVKLPTMHIIHPRETYSDRLAFAPGTMADGTVFYGYHIMPSKAVYNANLEWQKSSLFEIGFDTKIYNTFISLTAYYRKTHNPFSRKTIYSPFSYKYTSQEALEISPIPSKNRKYEMDRETGIITVKDITGVYPEQELAYTLIEDFLYNYTYENNTPLHRWGIEWVVDFGKIKTLNTSFRIDGNYYHYKGTEEKLIATVPGQMMSDGSPYKYVAFYRGGSNHSNGNISKSLRSNITIITHIPKIRLVVSLRIETALYAFEKYLSQYKGKARSFVLDDKDDFFPSKTKNDIYKGNQYIGLYPEYYVSIDDMQTKIPFIEKFAWAKQNDKALFNELTQMVQKTSYLNFFDDNSVSAFFSAHIRITKEIGEFASLSFNAKNFFNNMGTINYSRYKRKSSLYGSGQIPNFYYGLTLRLKL